MTDKRTMAEKFAATVGSWKFINFQTVAIALWIFCNSFLFLWIGHAPFDPFPYVLLNLFFSTQAAYASPIILMAQVAQAKRDENKEKKMQEITVNIERNTAAILAIAEVANEHDERMDTTMKLQTDAIKAQTVLLNRMAIIIEQLQKEAKS